MFISYPFSIDASGKVATAQTPRKVWLDRVRSVVNTQFGMRVMRPTFGMDSLSSVYNAGTPAEKSLEEQVREAFSRHLPALTITRAQARTQGSTTTLDLVFTSPDNTETSARVSLNNGDVTFDTN